MTEEYPEINFYSMTKSEWDSLFGMIPWLERIEKIDPNETYTDHGGKRTRPLKYVEYKSASVQLIGKAFKLLKPFDWTNWEEGLKILKTQSFDRSDLITIGKLLTIILYYKESTAELSQFGIACQAHDLEDGRVLKLLKELKNIITEEQKNECKKYHTYNPQDSNFANYAKLLQSKWCDKKGYPIAKPNYDTANCGHFIETEFAINGEVNFLTENIRKLVIEELETKETVQEHIYENLISSKSLCFNLFGELHFNLKLATDLFRKIFPKATSPYSQKLPEIGEVTSVLFDYSPYKSNNKSAEETSYFDVFIEYISDEGKKGFIGIDVRYAETLLEKADEAIETYKKYENDYLKLAEDLFLQENLGNFKKPPLFQLWHKHLLALSILKNNLYEEGFFLFLFPYGNDECYKEANLYRDQQKFPYKWNEHKSGFYWRFLDDFIDNLDELVNQNWTKELKERYLGR